MILFSHPTGNANVRAALSGLLEAGLLKEFHTAVAAYLGNIWDRVSRLPGGREFRRRKFDARLQPLTVQHPWRELGRMATNRLKLYQFTRHEAGIFCIDAVYRSLDKAVARRIRKHPKNFTGVYAYEDGALATFTTARENNLQCFYDLPIAYWETAQKLLREEAERLPAWEPTLGGTRDSADKLARKTKELELANTVICPSRFVADSVPERARREKRIVIIPFGSPVTVPREKQRSDASRKLRVLFAGSLTQRKGLGDLLDAMRLLNRNDVELVILGSPQAPMEFYRQEWADFIYESPRAHGEVLKLMRSCDVFCLPSIVEGRALVMQEAMSQGLPIIITANTGGEDLIEEGSTGFLVPIRRPDKIAEKIVWFADNRALLPEMSRAAQCKAAQLTWEAYGRELVEKIKSKNLKVEVGDQRSGFKLWNVR